MQNVAFELSCVNNSVNKKLCSSITEMLYNYIRQNTVLSLEFIEIYYYIEMELENNDAV